MVADRLVAVLMEDLGIADTRKPVDMVDKLGIADMDLVVDTVHILGRTMGVDIHRDSLQRTPFLDLHTRLVWVPNASVLPL